MNQMRITSRQNAIAFDDNLLESGRWRRSHPMNLRLKVKPADVTVSPLFTQLYQPIAKIDLFHSLTDLSANINRLFMD